MHYIGMDVHKKVTMICILNDHGKIVREAKVTGSLQTLLNYLKTIKRKLSGTIKIGYEASGGSGWLHDQLVALGMKVQVAHPGKLRMIFRSKRKNDRVDAQKIAKLLYLDEMPLAYIPSIDIRQWRALIEYRHGLVVRRGSCKCRLRALLHTEGAVPPRGLWTTLGRTWLQKVELPEYSTLQRDLLLTELTELEGKTHVVEKALREKANQVPGVGLLMTIPGVGIRTAEAVVAYIAQPGRFRRNKSVGCYFGLVPCEDSSVKTRLGHITKDGPATVRWLLTEATLQAIRRHPSIRGYYEKICRHDPGRKRIAVVATAHYLLRVMHAMLRTGEIWRSAAA